MPKLTTPEGMPEEVLAVVDVIGNNVRTEILRSLSRRPLTALELAERIGVHHASVHRHLVVLEEHGLVAADVDRGRRVGKTVTWQTVSTKVAEFGRIWVEYASGDD